MINRALNIRFAIKKMEQVPKSLFGDGVSVQIVQAIVQKTKINL